MMISKSELAKIQGKIDALDSAIKAEKHYLETLEPLIPFAKNSYVEASKALNAAKTGISNCIEQEKLDPTLKENIRWQSIKLNAEKNEEKALQKYLGWEKHCTEMKAKYEEHSNILSEYETKRQAMVTQLSSSHLAESAHGKEPKSASDNKRKEMIAQLLSFHLAQNIQGKEPKHISDKDLAAAKESFLKTEFSVPRLK